MAVVGVGIDVVDVTRFAATVKRTPSTLARLFTDRELAGVEGAHRRAVRFAAKEAVAKALGAPGTLHWHDVEVLTDSDGRPHLEVRGTVAAAAESLGIRHWHLSMSHDGGSAVAMVLAES